MAVRENSIHSPREEMAQLQKDIERERETRRSFKVSSNPEYYSSQKEYLEAQIKMFQDKLDSLEHRFQNADEEIQASFARQREYEKRYNLLKHREKIARIARLQEEINLTKAEMGD